MSAAAIHPFATVSSDFRLASLSPLPRKLTNLGVILERWSVTTPDLKGVDLKNPTPDLVRAIVNEDKEKEKRLYDTRTMSGSMDLIALSPETPKLDELLVKFAQRHTHESPEIRLILDGEGIFYIYIGKDKYEVRVQKGDFLFLPANVIHNFTLTQSTKVTALRVFQIPGGWEAKPVAE